MVKLDGKAAVITGAGQGIGRGIALAFGAEGAAVTVNDLNPDTALAVVREIRERGGTAEACIADAGDEAQVQNLVASAVERFGKLDIAVANAVSGSFGPFLETPLDDARHRMNLLLMGAYALSFYAARHMADRGEGGKLLFISSVHASNPEKDAAAYNMSKAGVNHLARSLANELAPHRINVNAIEPGWVMTPGELKYQSEAEMREIGRRLPWGRMGEPEDIARAALFLCSDDADYCTGSILRVDGGYMVSVSVS